MEATLKRKDDCTMENALEAKSHLKEYFSSRNYDWVAGVGVGKSRDGELALRVNVSTNIDKDNLNKIPKHFDNFLVQVVRLHTARLHGRRVS